MLANLVLFNLSSFIVVLVYSQALSLASLLSFPSKSELCPIPNPISFFSTHTQRQDSAHLSISFPIYVYPLTSADLLSLQGLLPYIPFRTCHLCYYFLLHLDSRYLDLLELCTWPSPARLFFFLWLLHWSFLSFMERACFYHRQHFDSPSVICQIRAMILFHMLPFFGEWTIVVCILCGRQHGLSFFTVPIYSLFLLVVRLRLCNDS